LKSDEWMTKLTKKRVLSSENFILYPCPIGVQVIFLRRPFPARNVVGLLFVLEREDDAEFVVEDVEKRLRQCAGEIAPRGGSEIV